MTTRVVDASVAVKWVVDEPGSEAAATLAGYELVAPDLLLIECANALWAKSRRGELDRTEATQRYELLARAPIVLVASTALAAPALHLALELGHPTYDCLYLALAIERRTRLITADRGLHAAVGHRADLARTVELLASAGRP